MKKRTQARRANFNKKPKQPTITQKQKTREFLKKARLYKTRPQRVSERKTFKAAFGYEQPRLSMAVGTKRADGTIKPGKASRYTVIGKKLIREPGERIRVEPEYRYEPIPREQRRPWGLTQRAILVKPGYWKTPKGKVIGEKLIVKRLGKKGTGKKGSSRGEGAVKFGSAASIRGMQKATRQKKKARAGGRVGREAKKKKKK